MARLTGAACRAARALLKWSMRDLVEASGISLPTVLKLENDGTVSEETADKIRAAFERQGVEITNGDGTGARLLFEEAWAHQQDGIWMVAARWRRGDPLEITSPATALRASEEARARGDERVADALRGAAEKAQAAAIRSGK